MNVSLYLILQSKVQMWQHVQTRTEQRYTLGHNGEFALFAFARKTNDAYYVASADFIDVRRVLLLVRVIPGVGHHLHFNSFASKIEEYQLGAGSSDGVNATGDAAGLVLQHLAVRHAVAVLLDEALERRRHVEFVRVGMLVGGFEPLDSLASELEVLLESLSTKCRGR